MEASGYKNITRDAFALAPLDSRLFDSKSTPLLNKVCFPNHIWQKVIELMSLSRSQKGNKRRGRVSYQLLSINQLGAVYEALLSYRGFFAKEDLFEVKPAGSRPPISWIVLVCPPERIDEYRPEEIVKDKDTNGVSITGFIPRTPLSIAWRAVTVRRAPAIILPRSLPSAWSNTPSKKGSRACLQTSYSNSLSVSQRWEARPF